MASSVLSSHPPLPPLARLSLRPRPRPSTASPISRPHAGGRPPWTFTVSTAPLLGRQRRCSGATSVHDVLSQYGLPQGLLPNSLKSYSLTNNGEFEVELSAPCYVQFSDLVSYERHIKGKLSSGSISDLSGVKLKDFVWLPITGILAQSADFTIIFEVGFGFPPESISGSLFVEIPVCVPRLGAADLPGSSRSFPSLSLRAKVGCRRSAGIISEKFPISEISNHFSPFGRNSF